VLRRIFGHEREEVTGECRKLHTEKLRNIYAINYYQGDEVRKDNIDWACSMQECCDKCMQNFSIRVLREI
jgi:hypothetical protein